ncbi:MAG: DNA repair protein RadC [Methanomicrobiales archaeon 53_19]|jgi:DNA repair protein RadC|uniref:RadC family protein n=1 Tax=Methanocalculus sp. TaxID=2004547 RepID=UPI00074668C2|nr:DNA repair protein RadC [Methanocalculus sp.]KUK69888.1 MAG: DNA repair protein RadC [Methanocalculus sp. 52_23]KUL03157.1 MAG: DNA repair protein RadC [Methanomicrobiales archaeon 53_19]HIJ07319.1 DNA repair protein RadC [Methanocalculus sp.]
MKVQPEARLIRETPEIDRPRERIRTRGAPTLSNGDLVAAIIGRGIAGRDVRTLSDEICICLDRKGLAVTCEDLIAIPGVGEAKACQILAAFELARRMLERTYRPKITSPEDALPYAEDIRLERQEHVICITLNGAHELIKRRTITKGILNQSQIHPREIFADAITDRAASIIIMHNHPSGNVTPSSDDITVTKKLAEAGEVLGIRLIDHIIVAENGFCSLHGEGYF